ncbi:MAG TPA: DUF1559 domain-containing protein, partial [Gemmataceae bacterium]|nr:DUF1559 domain-containing protein [Gemmataceae bacterium]
MLLRTRFILALFPLALFTLGLGSTSSVVGQEKETAKEPKTKTAKASPSWTLDEAMAHLELYPRDAYVQYVAMQLARRENKLDAISAQIERMANLSARQRQNDRARQVDLFSMFSGALAVQESLQMDAMRGDTASRQQRLPGRPAIAPPPGQNSVPEKPRSQPVAVADLKGPTIKSHPWETMLGDNHPVISHLSKATPTDYYFIEFHSLNKLLEAMDVSDLWMTHLFNQSVQEARTSLVGERLRTQLVVETNPVLRPFYDLAVEEVAVVGSDLFMREGSDVTLLFRIKQPEVFMARMEGFLTNAEKAHSNLQKANGEYLGVPYVSLASEDRSIHVFAVYPKPNLHIRTNSLTALKRVLEAIQGKSEDGKTVTRLGDTKEFSYIRTLMPQGSKEEDGFVYLSDPFIRHLVGPELKLTERRRMICYNHLRMIGHAGLLHRAENGSGASSLEALVKGKCLPEHFGEGHLLCPDGGKYSLSADGLSGVCSHHGHALSMIPCCEIPVSQVTAEEADEYRAFLDDYNHYWRTYFDPIALRLQISPERYRLETIVLPLIDNSIYSQLARTLGGKPEPLDGLPVPKRNIFSVAARVNKDELLKELPLDEDALGDQNLSGRANQLTQIALAFHMYHDAMGSFPGVANYDKDGKPLLSWRVHILPYIEEENLYKEFHLDEPWDSEHNKKLIARMPAVYARPDVKQKEADGKTPFLLPVGKDALFHVGPNQKVNLARIPDGSSNTILLVEADDDHAVTWTQPQDLTVDLKKPRVGLHVNKPDGILIAMADGSVHLLRTSIEDKMLGNLFRPASGEHHTLGPKDEIAVRGLSGRRDFLGLAAEEARVLKMREFLTKGIGNQISLNVYDAVPLFDFNLPNFLGLMLGSFNGSQVNIGSEQLLVSFVIASLNAPVYVALPVQDAKVVDGFLDRLDAVLAHLSQHKETGGFLNFEQDFYRFEADKEKALRTYSVRFGPVKWRFCWGRIGNGLYVASKPFILEDLLKLETERAKTRETGNAIASGPAAHAMIRMRPENWNQVLADYRLGWAENNRIACIGNVGPISSILRSVRPPATKTNKGQDSEELSEQQMNQLAEK